MLIMAMVGRVSVDPERIRSTITQERDDRGWTKKQLAQRSDLDPATVSRLESGEQSAQLPLLEKLAAGFGMPFEELLVRCGVVRPDYFLDPRVALLGDESISDPEDRKALVRLYDKITRGR